MLVAQQNFDKGVASLATRIILKSHHNHCGGAGLKENAVALRSQTDGLWDGAVLLVQPGNSIELEAVGRLCLVELKTGEKLVRHLARGYQLGEWKLTDLKGRSEVLEVVSAAPILRIRP